MFYVIRHRAFTPERVHVDVIKVEKENKSGYVGTVMWSTANLLVGNTCLLSKIEISLGLDSGKLDLSKGPLENVLQSIKFYETDTSIKKGER
jgi:hypothetical protein